MKIEHEKVVMLTYQLSIKDETDTWESIEHVTAEHPMAFICGMSGLPPKFEANLAGKSVGETFDFMLPAEDGYGDYDEEAIVELPIDIFKVDGQLEPEMMKVGNMIPMSNEEGHQMVGQIKEIGDTYILMDFNHPLAGREMWFQGSVLDIRNATAEELDHGHVHGIGGVEH
jgi:FKBP-type peptidyl-prolyl cis-trans isomerase SlyD